MGRLARLPAVSSFGLLSLTLMVDPAAAQDGGMNDIVVTARRTEERLQDVPISISVFNQQQLSNRNVVNASDLSTYTPSLSSNNRLGSENANFAIRGFIQENLTSPSVGVYFADVISPRATASITGGNNGGPGAFFDLQNVQVLKGPQGTLFGRNTTGGAVLLVPQKPTSNLEGYVEASIGNYDMRRAQAVVNVPLSETIRVRLGVDRNKRDGFLRNISGIGPKDFADVNSTAVRLSLVADITPDLENYTIFAYGKSDTNGFYPKVFSQDNRARDPFASAAAQAAGLPDLRALQIAQTSGGYYDVANGNPDAMQWIEQWQIINTTTWQASDAITLKNIMSYAQFRQKQISNIYGENGYNGAYGGINPAFNSAIFNPTSVNFYPAPGKYTISQSTFTEELQLQGRTQDGRLNFQAGVYVETARPLDGLQTGYSANGFLDCTNILTLQCSDFRGRLTPATANNPTLTGTQEGIIGFISVSGAKYRFNNLGAYAQATYKLTDQLSLTGGIRYTADKTVGYGQPMKIYFPSANVPRYECANPIGVVQGPLSGNRNADSPLILNDPSRCGITRTAKSNRPTWLLDIDYKPSEDVLLYAKYARGYRQGNVNVAQYGLDNWGPEKVDTYEIGAKTSFRGLVRGTFNISAFYNNFSDQQLQVSSIVCTTVTGPDTACPFIPSPGAGIANAGKSTIKGVEIEASINPFEGFNIDVGYAHLDTRIKELVAPAPLPGFTAFIVPAAGGRIPLAPLNKYSVTTSYVLPLAESAGRVTLAATFTHQDKTLGTTGSVGANRILPAQDLLNLNLNWASIAGAPVDFTLFVTNVTKEKFRVYTTGTAFGWDAEVLNQPRMIGARLRYRFGS